MKWLKLSASMIVLACCTTGKADLLSRWRAALHAPAEEEASVLQAPAAEHASPIVEEPAVGDQTFAPPSNGVGCGSGQACGSCCDDCERPCCQGLWSGFCAEKRHWCRIPPRSCYCGPPYSCRPKHVSLFADLRDLTHFCARHKYCCESPCWPDRCSGCPVPAMCCQPRCGWLQRAKCRLLGHCMTPCCGDGCCGAGGLSEAHCCGGGAGYEPAYEHEAEPGAMETPALSPPPQEAPHAAMPPADKAPSTQKPPAAPPAPAPPELNQPPAPSKEKSARFWLLPRRDSLIPARFAE